MTDVAGSGRYEAIDGVDNALLRFGRGDGDLSRPGASRGRAASRQSQAAAELAGGDAAPLGSIATGLRELAIEVTVVRLVVEGRLVEGLKDRGAAEPAQRLLGRCELGLWQRIQDLVKLGSGHW
ncbi:MAG TPA: hypothetical protein VMW75_18260 [Thermoanaerobaculia bacterium]|nr:hypothetical protein [Thermoanaerobaculia bacterium]